jgi:hypothetical protein
LYTSPPSLLSIKWRGGTKNAGRRGIRFVFVSILFLLSACNLTQQPPTPNTETIPITPAGTFEPQLLPTPITFFPYEVTEHLKAVYAYGQALGNKPDVFSKVGDSITVNGSFLTPFGNGIYNLADYGNLEGVVNFFNVTQARTGNSFQNRSLAAEVGWSAFGALMRSETDYTVCNAGETPLQCEYRLVRPSFALIMFGTNDVGFRSAEEYRADMRAIIEVSEGVGVIPIISTVPLRPGYERQISAFNQVIAELTTEYRLPLWDYSAAMAVLPNYGLTYDNVHPSSPPGNEDNAGNFAAEYLRYGYVVRNLTALQILDQVWQVVTAP